VQMIHVLSVCFSALTIALLPCSQTNFARHKARAQQTVAVRFVSTARRNAVFIDRLWQYFGAKIVILHCRFNVECAINSSKFVVEKVTPAIHVCYNSTSTAVHKLFVVVFKRFLLMIGFCDL